MSADMSPSPWLKPKAACAYIGISERHLYRLVEADRLPAYRQGRIVRFHTDDLDAYMRSGATS